MVYLLLPSPPPVIVWGTYDKSNYHLHQFMVFLAPIKRLTGLCKDRPPTPPQPLCPTAGSFLPLDPPVLPFPPSVHEVWFLMPPGSSSSLRLL